MPKFWQFLLVLVLLVPGFCAAGFAQAPAFSFNRPQTFDAKHYIVRLSFDRKNKRIFGETTVHLAPLSGGFTSFDLDAIAMKFDSVVLEPEGTPLKFKATNDKITINLPRAYAGGEAISVTLKYSASPKKGLKFVDEKRSGGQVVNPAQIWTDSEPDEVRYWFPSYDSPNDKATTEQFITVDKADTVIGNGEFITKTDNPEGTSTWHYKMPLPHPTYLTSFVAGRYVKVPDKYKEIPLDYYVYPGRESTIPAIFGRTKALMGIFEEITGLPYPFNKYDQVVIAGFKDAGMENITKTILSDTEIDFLLQRQPMLDDLIAHELAHAWFGNLVTCRNWAELWLNEGFATFMEAVFREKTFGRAEYQSKIREDALHYMVQENTSKYRQGLFNRRAGDINMVFKNPAITYSKGGAVIHTLRETVGEEAFWKAINLYLTRHKFGNVETTDLLNVMEETSGQDLDWFFNQWVYGTGYPTLDVEQTWDTNTNELKIKVRQTQKADELTPAAFTLPLNIEFNVGDEVRKEPVRITKREETFIFKTSKMPSSVEFDKEEKVPVKSVRIRPLLLIQ